MNINIYMFIRFHLLLFVFVYTFILFINFNLYKIYIIYYKLFGLIKNIYFNNVSQFSNLQNIKTNEIFKILFFLFLCMDIYVELWVLYGLLKV